MACIKCDEVECILSFVHHLRWLVCAKSKNVKKIMLKNIQWKSYFKNENTMSMNFKGWLKEDYGEVKRIKKFKWAKGRWICLVKVL